MKPKKKNRVNRFPPLPKRPLLLSKGWFLICILSLSRATASTEPDPLADLFSDYPTGCIAIYDTAKNTWLGHNEGQWDIRRIPASTFKIPHSLIALDSEVVTDPDSVFTWDGKSRRVSSWNKDQTLRSAVRVSAVWVFEEIGQKVGEQRTKTYLDRLNYGNKKNSGNYPYWLYGDLAISPKEQIEFLRRFANREFPIREDVYDTVADMIELGETNEAKVFAKTGWAQPNGSNVGWFVGWLEKESGRIFFATRIESKSTEGFGPARISLTMSSLRKLGYIGSTPFAFE